MMETILKKPKNAFPFSKNSKKLGITKMDPSLSKKILSSS